jgi:quinone-modifying oxidoreductase subunit QmoC
MGKKTAHVKTFALQDGKSYRKIRRRLKYESELDPGFMEKIAEIAHGEKIFNCIQCGTCSATCPVSHYMDYTPRKIIQMISEGFKEDVLKSTTVWICASCYSCTVECPKGIKITDVMYALKREAIEGDYYPKRFPTPVLAENFFNQVLKHGRNSEGPLLLKMYLKTNPFMLFKSMRLGFKLWRTGRLSLKTEKIKDKGNLYKILENFEKAAVSVRKEAVIN